MNTTSLSIKTGNGKGLTLTDDEAIRNIIGDTPAYWIDFDDKDTWFQDPELTVPALYREDVRYVKNKAGPGYMQIVGIEKDNQDRHYVESSDDISLHSYLLTNRPLHLLNNLEAIEQRFMQDMGIYPKVQE